MRRKLHLASLSVPILVLFADSASAQEAFRLPLFDGALLFRGDVGVTIDKRTAEQASTSLWRPFQPGLADKPIGGPRHYVLPHLAMQAGQQLYDLRMNYEFMHFQEPGDTDYAAIMHRYVDIEVPGIAASTTQQQGQ